LLCAFAAVVGAVKAAEMASFWIWEKWSPRDCWQQDQDKCCVSIYNYNGSNVGYTKTNTSPAISLKSLPGIGDVITEQPRRVHTESPDMEESEPILKRTRSRGMFR
jgi:hypothetical protein